MISVVWRSTKTAVIPPWIHCNHSGTGHTPLMLKAIMTEQRFFASCRKLTTMPCTWVDSYCRSGIFSRIGRRSNERHGLCSTSGEHSSFDVPASSESMIIMSLDSCLYYVLFSFLPLRRNKSSSSSSLDSMSSFGFHFFIVIYSSSLSGCCFSAALSLSLLSGDGLLARLVDRESEATADCFNCQLQRECAQPPTTRRIQSPTSTGCRQTGQFDTLLATMGAAGAAAQSSLPKHFQCTKDLAFLQELIVMDDHCCNRKLSKAYRYANS
eukprot:scaffold922_cov327-Pinguiococcus_pyrenoidosus.AAC.27